MYKLIHVQIILGILKCNGYLVDRVEIVVLKAVMLQTKKCPHAVPLVAMIQHARTTNAIVLATAFQSGCIQSVLA